MTVYRTVLTSKDLCFFLPLDSLVMPRLDETVDLRPIPRAYRSNWRVLHVDGFEEKFLQFFFPVKYEWRMSAVPRGQVNV